MNMFGCPKLKNRRTGAEIDLNANPFSIGRGLSCNYVMPCRTVSRVHCILEQTDDNSWVLKDTSTNGTFVNGKLVKQDKSPPLKDKDVISLEIDGVDSYLFLTESASDDISDEQLCAIADTVFNEMEFLSSSPLNVGGDDQLGAASLPVNRPEPDSTTSNPLLDHMYTIKSLNTVTKKARTGGSPRPILGCGSRRNMDGNSQSTEENDASSRGGDGSERTADPGTTDAISDNVPAISERGLGTTGDNGEGARSVGGESCSTRLDGQVTNRNDGGADGALANSEISKASVSAPQPGPSTALTEKPTEHQDNYEVMENELQCIICSELFVKAVTLNCSHSFCRYCIGMWNKNKSDCPICRTKITSTAATIVLDNIVEKVILGSSEEIKQHRRSLLDERKKLDEAENKPPPKEPRQRRQATGRGRATARGVTTRRARGGRGNAPQDAPPRINVLDPVAINIGALVNNVIEVSSDSDWSSDTESMSPNDMQEEYDYDDWYDTRNNYWGGYGYCYRCGSPTHWANNCPNR